jgi:beta-1,4-mannosyl-glycoprotein beta-1,4-N-acetylglucosaminyltransferase
VTRPKIIDTFPIHDELDLLECRLTEIAESVDYVIAVEADVTHQDRPKPFYLSENLDRFTAWKDKLIVVRATGLPTLADDDNAWARELAQRGYVAEGLVRCDAANDDIILHSDVDEIPTAIAARNVRPKPGWFVTFNQRLHCFAVDWLHPEPWFGTVAARVDTVAGLIPNGRMNPFALMRDKRNRFDQPGWRVQPDPLFDAGWHLSWLGGQEAAFKKLGSFCHPEVADRVHEGLSTDLFLREGWHVDGRKMAAVDVDESWPKWIVEGKAPASWFRPR